MKSSQRIKPENKQTFYRTAMHQLRNDPLAQEFFQAVMQNSARHIGIDLYENINGSLYVPPESVDSETQRDARRSAWDAHLSS